LKLDKRRFVNSLLALCFVFFSTSVTPAQSKFSAADEAFLEDLQERLFQYFWRQADPQTGLVADRARTDDSALDQNHQNVGSIAATGFGLTALCIASERRWIESTAAKERTRATLRFFADRVYHQQGWFYHWLDTKTGQRRWNSEVSSIDTALLLAGVLTVRQCFAGDQEIVSLATRIYNRVEFSLDAQPSPVNALSRLETGNRLPQSTLGHVQRRHDSLSSRDRITGSFNLSAVVVCHMERSISLRRPRILHYDRRTAFHASVLARLG
jgi:hypothetical protein